MFVSLHSSWYNMVATDIHSSRHSMLLMDYYIVWMSKYRKAILHGEIRDVVLSVLLHSYPEKLEDPYWMACITDNDSLKCKDNGTGWERCW